MGLTKSGSIFRIGAKETGDFTMSTLQQSVRNGGSQSVYERYTESLRRAIVYAREEVEHRCGSAITIGDLLAGLSVDEDTRADRTGNLKSNAFYLRWLVGLPALPARGLEDAAVDYRQTGRLKIERSHVELDNDAKRAFAFALMEADRDGEYWIDSDHLLRGILRFPNQAQFAVLKTEVNLTTVRLASHQDRLQLPPDEAPGQKVREYRLRKYAAMFAPVVSLVCYLYILMQSFGMALIPLAK